MAQDPRQLLPVTSIWLGVGKPDVTIPSEARLSSFSSPYKPEANVAGRREGRKEESYFCVESEKLGIQVSKSVFEVKNFM
jgi:hypothetical protein